ncbi:MAG: hypothetical protein WAM61_21135 [Desulfobacterales bacterium]
MAVAVLASAFLHACAGLAPQQKALPSGRPSEAESFLATLDAAVTDAGVLEASSYKVPGFPYLRTDRFLAAMPARLVDEKEKELWIEEMFRLDVAARKKEIRNLPDETVERLSPEPGATVDRESFLAKTSLATASLLEHDRQQPYFFETVKAAATVPEEYSTAMRVFGLYPVAAVPITIATRVAYDTFKKWHRSPLSDLTVEGRLTVFAAEGDRCGAAGSPATLFAAARRNAFGLPELGDAETAALVRFYAPVISQDTVAGYDRFGEVFWQDRTVAIDQRQPALYFYITRSFIDRQPVWQINYVFWYSERSGRRAPAYEKGPLDGLTLRLSLDRDGQPVMVDIMNNCGCYHFYVPRRERVAKTIETVNGLYPFVPAWLPPEFPDQPLTLRVNSGWHQVEHVSASPAPADALRYRLLPYDGLEALPHADGSHESVFTAAGIMKNSSRIEPYIFFSVGIPDIGYMRQRGHHAVTMIGRAHFTDADIFDGYFVFRTAGQEPTGAAW